jgi:hypothetical protein
MGAHDFQSSMRAKSMRDAYNQLVEYAIEEHGNDSYNGTISTTRGFKDVTSKYKSSKMTINQFIDKHIDDCNKWGEAWGICIEEPVGNNLKVKTQVTHSVSKGTKKWVLKYVVYQYDTRIGSKDTKGDAVKLAREYTEKHGKRTTIVMEKVLESGSNMVAEVTYKSSDKEKDGKYLFFGMAAS